MDGCIRLQPSSGIGLMEDKKETIYFLACLSEVNIQDVSVSLTKETHVPICNRAGGSGTDLMEDKKETIYFLACLS
jgi:hypothetical protein